jgi:uncharacterized membrane protein
VVISIPETTAVAAPLSAAVIVRVTDCPALLAVSVTGAGHAVVNGAVVAVHVKVTVTGVRYHP